MVAPPPPVEHYQSRPGELEPIDVIRTWELDFLEGNVVKYLARYPYKGSAVEDLKKARQYLTWLIEREEMKQSTDLRR